MHKPDVLGDFPGFQAAVVANTAVVFDIRY